jgi:hypothetical protein
MAYTANLNAQQPPSLDKIIGMIVQGKPKGEIEKIWKQILAANPQMDPKVAVSYIRAKARQKLEGNLAVLKSRQAESSRANVELQNSEQKQQQQQLLQMLTMITKVLNDTAMSTSRKTGN